MTIEQIKRGIATWLLTGRWQPKSGFIVAPGRIVINGPTAALRMPHGTTFDCDLEVSSTPGRDPDLDKFAALTFTRDQP